MLLIALEFAMYACTTSSIGAILKTIPRRLLTFLFRFITLSLLQLQIVRSAELSNTLLLRSCRHLHPPAHVGLGNERHTTNTPLKFNTLTAIGIVCCHEVSADVLIFKMAKLLKKPLKLALVQLASGSDKAANLSHARSKVLEATSKGANVVVLPECFNSPYGCKYFPSYAETLLPSPPTESQSPSFYALSKLAKESKAYLVGGSIPEYWEETKKYYNTSLTFGPDGKLLATHRKVHLFDIDIPGKITFKESEVLSPGNKVTIVDLPEYGKIAVAICYDVRFPELAMIAARKGCFLLLYPGAFNLTTGALHWKLQARARAMDNQVYVGMCSPARDMQADYNAWGHSMIVDPNAGVLGELEEKEDVIYADLNGETIEETRKSIPIYTQRRFDVYPDVSEGKVSYED